jgi:hypothetical protein
MYQLSIQFSNSKDTLRHYFETATGKPVSVILTDNSTSVLSVKTKSGSISVRMHWMFLNAGEEILREMAAFIKTRRGRTPLIGKFISENRACLRQKAHDNRHIRVCTRGSFFDLKEIFDNINNEYFGGSVTSSIGWGKKASRRAVRKRTLGSYCRHTDSIRISPVLDRKYVPLYFIRFVVYHEMLHSSLAEEKKEGRRWVHNSEFRKHERLFMEYDKAVSWEKSHGTR